MDVVMINAKENGHLKITALSFPYSASYIQ